MQIIISMYAMGRMQFPWREDCHEFKPDRWALKIGKIRYVLSYKFLVFNSGLGTCLEKDMSVTIMKVAAIAMIDKYHIKPVQGHPIVPDVSLVLYVRHGFNAPDVTHFCEK